MQDPLRSFTGRDKYKRPLWATAALNNPSVVRKSKTLLLLLKLIPAHNLLCPTECAGNGDAVHQCAKY